MLYIFGVIKVKNNEFCDSCVTLSSSQPTKASFIVIPHTGAYSLTWFVVVVTEHVHYRTAKLGKVILKTLFY